MEKHEALNYLIEVEKKQGEHNGRWESEAFEYTTERYYRDITGIADNIGISYAKGDEFKKEIERLKKSEDCFNALDEWTFMLTCNIEKYLINIILS